MIKLVSVSEMREIEKEANAGGLTYEQMMENAGSGLAGIVQSAYSQVEPKIVVGLVGSGNNGGDTLVALRELAKTAWKAHAIIVRERAASDPLVEELKSAGGQVDTFGAEGKNAAWLDGLLERSTVLLDGVLGTGIKLPLKKEIAAVLALAKEYVGEHPGKLHVVAVDCPSGVDSDNGEAAQECIPAEMTVCMAAIKTGLLEFPAFNFAGTLRVAGIGLPEDLPAWEKVRAGVVDEEYARRRLPERRADAHKGTFGTALAVIGSVNYTGAALLAGRAAYRVGAGLVTLGVPSPLHAALAGHFPEGTWLLLPHELGVISSSAVEPVLKNLERVTALLLGPGWAQEDTTREFLERLLRINSPRGHPSLGFVHALDEGEAPKVKLPPLVIDADGLKLLAKIPEWWKHLPEGAILTPHPGEMAVLSSLSTQEIQSRRLEVALEYARKWGVVLVLKGANTIVAEPEGRAMAIPVATSALARAGTGDVLAGAILGLRAQGMAAFDAAVLGAWLHAQAGLKAAEQFGNTASVLAGDVLAMLPAAITDLGQGR